MDTDKKLRAELVKTALAKTDDIKSVTPTVLEWLKIINMGNVGNTVSIPKSQTPKKTTSAKSEVKPQRKSIKAVANGGNRWTETDIENLNKIVFGKKITKQLIERAATKMKRSPKSVRLRIRKIYSGESLVKKAIQKTTKSTDRFANARAAKALKAQEKENSSNVVSIGGA